MFAELGIIVRRGRPVALGAGPALVAAWLVCGSVSPARGQQSPPATVTVDGTNVNGIVFTWDVTNHARKKAINYFEVPVHDINTFESPPGWETVSAPRLRKGVFILKTDDYPSMVRFGRTLQFRCMRPLRDVPRDGRVEVVIGFDDGSRITVPNVLGPVKRSALESWGVPIFLGLILAIVFVSRALRGRKPAAQVPPGPQADSSVGTGADHSPDGGA